MGSKLTPYRPSLQGSVRPFFLPVSPRWFISERWFFVDCPVSELRRRSLEEPSQLRRVVLGRFLQQRLRRAYLWPHSFQSERYPSIQGIRLCSHRGSRRHCSRTVSVSNHWNRVKETRVLHCTSDVKERRKGCCSDCGLTANESVAGSQVCNTAGSNDKCGWLGVGARHEVADTARDHAGHGYLVVKVGSSSR